MNAHALLAPSAAGRWVACPASVTLEARYPETPSDAADAGTAAHEYAADMIRAGARGQTVPPPGAMPDESVDAARVYADHTLELMRSAAIFGGDNIGIESRVDCSKVHTECWGTPDFWMYDTKTATLTVNDFKHGRTLIEAPENWQLITYAAGLLQRYGVGPGDINVHLTIVQPNVYHQAGPVRTWDTSAVGLRAYINRLQFAAAQALGDNPNTQSGPHCLHCSARHECDTSRRAGLAAVDYIGGGTTSRLPGPALGAELALLRRAQEAIKTLLTGYEAEALARINTGETVGGWAVENGRGRQVWDRPLDDIYALGDLYGIDLRKPGAPTPKQAQKLGIDEAVIRAYSSTPMTGAKLVPLDKSLAVAAFGQKDKA